LLQAFPDQKRVEADSQPWTPRDFYENVHVPSKDVDTNHDFRGLLDSELYAFQKRAIHWMLQREGMKYESGQLPKLSRPEKPRGLTLFEVVEDLDGVICHVNHLQGIISRDVPDRELYLANQLSGGLLAEEMGLGKTMELMALLRLHKSSDNRTKPFINEFGLQLTPSRATLIVTPPTILNQWRSELSRHAPAMRVLVYEGVNAKSTKEKASTMADLTSNYDVILTTYATLTREIHFAEDPPDRNMRHVPKFERKRSPLVEIQWWRICLDEAQMVESGVTAAARVACRLPRVHSWAVSGTPLRKNVQDLHGLLIFLRYKPFCEDSKLWSHLVTNHKHIFCSIFREIALRHTKAQIREDLHLPPQKRVVITVPFSAVEQQHYSTMFAEMCQAVGVDSAGAPKSDDWDPESPLILDTMRTYLRRLRQTCLHPQIGDKNRKALGRGAGPLRTVAEVLEVMIDQKETSIRVEERALLSSQLLRAHILGNAREDEHRAEKALAIYLDAVSTSTRFVTEARDRLARAQAEQGEVPMDTTDDEEEETSSTESTPLLGKLRNNLRNSLQLQHACAFFAATAYFQIKTNTQITEADSAQFKALEEKEVHLYESAKLVRREILKDSSKKAERLTRKIKELEKQDDLTKIPKFKDLRGLGGIESRRIVEKSDDLFDVIRGITATMVEWRTKMAEYLAKPLVDEDEGIETTGDEYEDSTKTQDELYAYFDACKFMQADLQSFITGESAPLIDHEAKSMGKAIRMWFDPNVVAEMRDHIHAPELMRELLLVRKKFRDRLEEVGSVRGLIQDARNLETSLHGQTGGGVRAAEGAIVRQHLQALQAVFSSLTKTSEGLEKEIELFRLTQNQRLEFYRQLQELSDAVEPLKDELDETLDLTALESVMRREELQATSLAKLQTQNRYLLSLRDETGHNSGPKICVICQFPFEYGVLTVCGHQFCKECIHHWWTEHKTCPVCKRVLGRSVDFHSITYRPQELRAQEEKPQSQSQSQSQSSTSPLNSSPTSTRTMSPTSNSSPPSAKDSASTSIYTSIDPAHLTQIKSIDLPISYGTKIDTLGRQLHWLRTHDPGAKSILFSQYRSFLDILSVALRDFKLGAVRLGKANAVEKFKHDPSVECLLLDAKTDSSGLTLVGATHVFICEPLVNTAVELQAIARVHRIGQTRETTVWCLVVGGTVEESIYELSVARRLAHVKERSAVKTKTKAGSMRDGSPAVERAVEAAESEVLQSKAVGKLLDAGKAGGELVGNSDLWTCLFGHLGKGLGRAEADLERERVVGRFAGAEAAETRRAEALATAGAGLGDHV